MEKVNAALFKMLGKSKLTQDRFYLQQLRGHWPDLVGKVLSQHTFPEKFSRKRLVVFTDNPAWSSEMMIHKEFLLGKFNKDLGGSVLKEMSFLLGKTPFSKKKNSKSKISLEKLPPLTAEETQKALASCPRLNNKKLQAQAQAFTLTKARQKKYLQQQEVKKCPGCGTYLAEGETICSVCRLKQMQEQRKKIAACLEAAPWLSAAELLSQTGIAEPVILSVKESLKSYYGEKVRQEKATDEEIRKAVFLQSGLSPQRLTPALFENVQQFLRGKKRYVHSNGK